MKDRERRQYEQLLLARREGLLKAQGTRLRPNPEPAELSDAADLSRVSRETKITQRLRQTGSHLLRAIEEALDRIKRASFGTCTQCGRPVGRVWEQCRG